MILYLTPPWKGLTIYSDKDLNCDTTISQKLLAPLWCGPILMMDAMRKPEMVSRNTAWGERDRCVLMFLKQREVLIWSLIWPAHLHATHSGNYDAVKPLEHCCNIHTPESQSWGKSDNRQDMHIFLSIVCLEITENKFFLIIICPIVQWC